MKLLLLDKDGTLISPASGAKFVQNPQDQELLPGVAEMLARYVEENWLPVIVSNQGGVFAGHKSMEDAIAEMRFCMELTGINDAFFCPCDPETDGDYCIHFGKRGDTNSWGWMDYNGTKLVELGFWDLDLYKANILGFRKPKPGMLLAAIGIIPVRKVTEILMVGDRPEDAAAAEAAGVPFISAEDWRAGN